jgi:DNA-binding MarR family transcriptional regulator
VTPNECYALEAIERAGALTVVGLADALGLHKSNASRLADALQDRGLLRREADSADGRAIRLVVTAQGRRTHDAIRARVLTLQNGILRRHPAAVRQAFVRLLGELAAEAACRARGGGSSSSGMRSSRDTRTTLASTRSATSP